MRTKDSVPTRTRRNARTWLAGLGFATAIGIAGCQSFPGEFDYTSSGQVFHSDAVSAVVVAAPAQRAITIVTQKRAKPYAHERPVITEAEKKQVESDIARAAVSFEAQLPRQLGVAARTNGLKLLDASTTGAPRLEIGPASGQGLCQDGFGCFGYMKAKAQIINAKGQVIWEFEATYSTAKARQSEAQPMADFLRKMFGAMKRDRALAMKD